MTVVREQWWSPKTGMGIVIALSVGSTTPVHASHVGTFAIDGGSRARVGARSLDAPRPFMSAHGSRGLPVAMHASLASAPSEPESSTPESSTPEPSIPEPSIPEPSAAEPSAAEPSELAPDSVSDGRPLPLPPPPPPPPPPEPQAKPSNADSKGRIRWGLERPVARWKWGGFGVSAGVLATAGATTLGLSIWLRSERGGFRRRLLEEAEASLEDDNPNNDVNPNVSVGVDLCEFASQEPNVDGNVRNAQITQHCERGDTVRRVSVITSIVSVVGLASTAVFTVLMFTHREPKSRTARAWRRHGLQVGLRGSQGSGATVEVGGRF